MSIVVQLPNEKPVTVNGRLEAIIRKLLLATGLIEHAPPIRITIHCGKDADDVSVEVPVRY